jgi:hypothetical protein
MSRPLSPSLLQPRSLQDYAERTLLGVDDGSGLFKAALAAIDVLGHREYQREDLIPAVTRFVGNLADTMAEEFSENKIGTCEKYLKVLRTSGAVE